MFFVLLIANQTCSSKFSPKICKVAIVLLYKLVGRYLIMITLGEINEFSHSIYYCRFVHVSSFRQ